jgi:predicted transcriptional regulator of viral defense system
MQIPTVSGRVNRGSGVTRREIAMQEQEYLTVDEVAKMLKVSRDTVSRRFEKEPGVIDLGTPERLHKRRYRVLRIPAAVLNRFLHKKRVA